MSSDRTITVDAAGSIFLQWSMAQAADSLDYTLDLSAIFNTTGDIVAQVVVDIAPNGSGELTASNLATDGKAVNVTLSGGVPGRLYRVRFDVGTLSGRQYSWVSLLPISNEYAIYAARPPVNVGFGPAQNWALMELENQQGFWQLESGNGRWVWG